MHRRPSLRLTVSLIVPPMLAAAIWLVSSRAIYKQWPWEKYPNPLTWCGRRWVPAGTASRAEILHDDYDFHRAGSLPGLLNVGSVWTSRTKGATEFGTRCKITDVWVQLASDKFEAMGLSGSF